jgi:hypothetical protein
MNPVSNGSSDFGEVAEIVLSYTLLLQAAKEAFHDSIFWGVYGVVS